MRFISLPISDLISYLTDAIEEWPAGHNLEQGRESEIINMAAAAFAKDYIRSGIPYLSENAEPMLSLLSVLGYPVKHMSEEEVENLENDLDDYFMTMTTIMDVMVDGISEFLKNKEITITHKPGYEDIVINIDDDVRLIKLRRDITKLKELMPPRRITAKNIDDAELSVGRFVGEAFKACTSEAVRVELKRIFDVVLKRH